MWLPIALAFAIAATVTGFGFGAILSSPGAVVFAVFVFALLMLPGAVLGGLAIAATRVADRVVQGMAPRRDRMSTAVVHAAVAGVVVGLTTWWYLALTQRADNPLLIAPVAFVAVVAAIFASRAAWMKESVR
ncbi:hypothetical protein QMK17_13345 [Rhodococcus sp. G-MC3]|nr:hypothetical protein [Rhodococcus sp. G-MC3]